MYKINMKMLSCMALAVSFFTACGDIKFIEKVSQTESSVVSDQETDSETATSSGNDNSWKTQTLVTTNTSYHTIALPEIDTPISETTTPTETSEEMTSAPSEEVSDSDSETIEDEYFVDLDPQQITFTKSTKLYKSATDTKPFKIKAGQQALLTGESIDGKWKVVYFAGSSLLVLSDSDCYKMTEETETTVGTTTTPSETSVVETTTEETTETTTATTSAQTTHHTTTTQATTTTVTTTHTTTQATTTYRPPQPVTEQSTTSQTTVQTTAQPSVTGNVGGIEFPSDTTKTSLVFGITFVNMDIQIRLVNDVEISSGPGKPNGGQGYINLGMLEAGTEMKCLGMSYDGWLRVRLPNGKIGFIYNNDAEQIS